jgi:hypothetical protein
MTVKASHILAAGFVAIAGMAAQALLNDKPATPTSVEAASAAAPEVFSPSKAFAEKAELPFHLGQNSYSTEMLAHFLTWEAPQFKHMKLEKNEAAYTVNGKSGKEVYTIDLYVQQAQVWPFSDRHRVYANKCTVSDGDVTSEITFALLDKAERFDRASSANDEVALAILSDRQCQRLSRDGHLEAFKELAMGRAAAE